MKLHVLAAVVLLATCVSAGLFSPSKKNNKRAAAPGPPVFCPSLPLPTMSTTDFITKITSFLDEAAGKIQSALDEEKAPGGVAMSVVYRNATIWTKGFGLVDMKDSSKGPPGPNTGFRIGSITKVLTSLMTLILRDNKKLRSLDADITEYLSEFKINNPFKTNRGISFRQLMSHMAGLPRESPCEDIFRTGCKLSDSQIYKNLAGMKLMYPPGQQPSYSNLGFGLLGRTLEKITKSKWEDSVKKMVFEPLGMTDSGNSFPADVVKNMAIGYYPDGHQAEFISIGWESPAGQAYSSVADLGKLMSLLFTTDKSLDSKKQILDGETIREWIEQPAYKYSDGTGFGYPWELVPLGNYTLRTKDGAINGYNSEFQMAPEIKTGFVFLHSCDGCSSHSKITAIGQSILTEASNILSGNPSPPRVPPANKIMDYVGVFATELGNTQDVINITYAMPFGHPMLFVSEGGANAILQWQEDDSFQISVQGFPVPCFVLGAGHIGEWIYFQRSLLGKVNSLTIPGLSYGKVWKKQ